jgi:hypothetical protein
MSKTDKRQSASRTGPLRIDPRTSSTIRDKIEGSFEQYTES